MNGDGAATVVASLERTNRLGSCHLVWTAAQARTNYRLAASYHVPLFILHLSWNEPKALPMKLRAPDGAAYTCQYAIINPATQQLSTRGSSALRPSKEQHRGLATTRAGDAVREDRRKFLCVLQLVGTVLLLMRPTSVAISTPQSVYK